MSESLKVFEQEPRVIGQFGEKQVAVYPPSLARIHKIIEAIQESKTTLFQIGDEMAEIRKRVERYVVLAKTPEGLTTQMVADRDELLGKLSPMRKRFMTEVRNQIKEIAPILVLMTAKPLPDYSWEPVFTDKDFIDGMPNITCAKIVSVYGELSEVEETLKKITALSG